jgi:2-polyprenyl-3-methyl-5-hydroxy-6-metoxy-1,4-benzoquinol methylase
MKQSTLAEMDEIWDKFVDWKQRAKVDGSFVKNVLNQNRCKTVYDLCVGGGFDSVFLLQNGFDVTSNDIEPTFIKTAQENAQKQGVSLNITNYDWRKLPVNPKYDAALMIGNSLTCLKKTEDREKAAYNTHNLLNKKGIFIVDHRNFEYISENKDEILKGNFISSGKYLYSHNKIEVRPIEINKRSVLFEYIDKETRKKYHRNLSIILEKEMLDLLKGAGFKKIETFYDYQIKKPEHYDFVQHVAHK